MFALPSASTGLTAREIRCTPSFGRDRACSVPAGRKGRSGVATAGSDVSFIEQIGGGGTEPSCG